MDNIKIIIGSNGRILRPIEFRTLLSAIPKVEHKDKFETLIFTGCRYNELRWLYKHPNAFSGNVIQMPSLKPEAVHKDRYIKLNAHGVRAVERFLQSKRNLPAHPGWDENLIRWCKLAGIDKTGISCKTTRKTWESWLATTYPNNFHNICLSQGHTDKISLDYYLMLPFTNEEKKEIQYYTEGWI